MEKDSEQWIPHEVVKRVVEYGETPVRAWREHLALTVKDVSMRMGVAAEQYVAFEESEAPNQALLSRFSEVVGISVQQVDV